MPSRYSHSLVLDNYENLGLINRSQYRPSPDAAQGPPSLASTAQLLPASPASPAAVSSPTVTPPSNSQTSTPTPALTRTFSISTTNARSSSVPSSPSHVLSRDPSFRTSRSSASSTASSSHLASSVVTQIYAPQRPASQTRTGHRQPVLILADSPSPLDFPPNPTLQPSPGTVHTRTNSSSTPRSRGTTAGTSLDVHRSISPVSKDSVEDEEPYFGSEEDAASLSSLSSSTVSSRDYPFDPWRDSKAKMEPYQLPAPYTPLSDDYGSTPLSDDPGSTPSIISRQRGSSTDDAEPPPIARTRRVQFLSPRNSLKDFKHSSASKRLSFLRSPFSISHRALTSSYKEPGFSNPKVLPYGQPPQARPSQSIDQARNQSSTGGWQASNFDISGMPEAEQKRLWKKGVNPRLKAEMEAARSGKWMGPLVGNTFIG